MEADLIKQITNNENLFWAWQKTKKAFSVGDIWYCEYELAKFESNIYKEIELIRNDVLSGNYKLTALKIVPFPKGADKNEEANTIIPRTRQAFYVSVRDQVTWLALCNVIGESLDSEMPAWSYGNRLYRPAWYERKDGESKIVIGNYRNYNGHIFRKWKQSWPLFRKHINATIAVMANPFNSNGDYSEDDNKTIQENNNLEISQQLSYLTSHYFSHKKLDKLYWCTLDFEKFYPNLARDQIKKIIIKELKLTEKNELVVKLINELFDFQVDFSGWDEYFKDLGITESRDFKGLPTGLLVAGFLANIALLNVDRKLSFELKKNKNIAHFRFVDDHVLLSTSFDVLIEWIDFYKNELAH